MMHLKITISFYLQFIMLTERRFYSPSLTTIIYRLLQCPAQCWNWLQQVTTYLARTTET